LFLIVCVLCDVLEESLPYMILIGKAKKAKFSVKKP